ncbi:MAG: right-handed parallel beta-helix repeat-containing protein, partial [Bacteroidales bacterium]|nr:right-handed parallel beta-helix repeat-containing protein [Bacteroidales bacterium]
PLMLNCVFRNAVTDGVKCYNAFNSIETSTFSNNGRYPLFFAEPLTLPTLNGNTYTGNGINLIGFSGGTISENRTMQYDGIGYHILDNITIGRYAEVRRLTIEPGVNLYFDPGKMIQAGYHTSYYYGGELYAEGTAGMPITFTPYNGVAGSWNGIYFHDNSDWNGATNSLQYCVVEKANDYNIYCDNTGSVTIDNCIIRDAVTDGLRYNASYGSFSNNVFGNNGRYPVYMMDWTSQPVHNDNTFNSKGINYIALSGGTYTESRTITADNAEYLVLGDILIGKYANINRLTIKPGVTLNFDLNTNIQVGYHSGYYYGGELYAEGNTDSLIVFRPYNGVAGGWDGIYFHDNSDWNGATSSLRFCRIEKGSGYNVFSENTSQPTLTDSYLTGSAGEGMRMNNASPVIRTIDFTNNAGHGIFLDGSSNPDIGNDPSYTCNLYLNGLYNVYNNTTNNIDARNNYWGTGDSAMIAQTIYDRYDNTAKGIVIFADFAQIPSLPATTTLLSGDVWYSNSVSTAMTNAQMQIFDFGGIPIASTVTNSLGHYAFAPFTSGNYTLTITPSDPWGGVNSTDGLLILNHFAKIDTLENMKLAAADVNASATINGTDALLVMRRYAGHISSFATGDWLYNSASLTINGNQVVNDFEMLCFGDVNSSYVPTDGDGGSVLLVYEGTQVIGSFSDFTVDVRIKEMIQAGAVSFGLLYPEEYMEVTGAQLLNTSGNVIFTAADGLTRIAWADLNPLTLQQDEVMIRLECQAKDLTGLLEPIYLELYPNTEFANPAGTVYQDVTLTVPGLVTLMTAVPTRTLDGLWLAKNYPNPFNESTTISYNIPTDGHVSIRVMSLTGTEVALVVDDYQTGGSYTVDFSSTGLEPGIYLYELVFGNSGGNYSIVNKMSVTR